MVNDDDVMGISLEDARRLSKMLRWYEALPQNTLREARSPRIVQPNRNAKTTSVISARSGDTKGSGTVDIYVDDQTGTGLDVSRITNVKVWNPYSSSIASGTWVTIQIVDGLNQIVGSDC